MPTFGERFKSLRLEKNMKQEELINDFNAKYHYNFSKSAVSQYENNKRIPEIQALNDFSNYFNVSVDYLLGRSNKRKFSELFAPSDEQLQIRKSLMDTLLKKGRFDEESINKTLDIIEAFSKRGFDIKDISLKKLDKVIQMYSIMEDIEKD